MNEPLWPELDLQMEAAKAMLNGETFIRRAMRWVDDPETGERVRKEVPVRYRPWFWKDEQGKHMLEVRYGNRRLELKPKKSTVEVGEAACQCGPPSVMSQPIQLIGMDFLASKLRLNARAEMRFRVIFARTQNCFEGGANIYLILGIGFRRPLPRHQDRREGCAIDRINRVASANHLGDAADH